MNALQPHRLVDVPRVIANARTFDLWSPDTMAIPSAETIDELFAALEHGGTRYLLVGGIALLRYVDGRNTEDIDIIVALPDALSVPGLVIVEHDRDFAWARFGDLKVDLLLSSNPLFAHVLEHHGDDDLVGERAIRFADPTGMVLLKLYALPSLYRQALHEKVRLYEADIAMLMQAQVVDTDGVMATLAEYVPASDAAELGSIVEDIRERIARGGRFG